MRHFLRITVLIFAAGAELGGDNRPIHVAEMQERAVIFERRHDPFVRVLFGCPPTGLMSDAVCEPKSGGVDYQLFKKARAAAAKFYDLKEE